MKLDAFTNQLGEVIVPPKKVMKPINGNTQAIVDKQYFDDEKSSPKNRTMPSDGTIENGMNFVRIYKDVIKTNKQKLNELKSSHQNLEKFAREQYLMKKENEDIFIIKE